MSELVHVGTYAHILASGRSIGPGDRVEKADLEPEDGHLIDEGHLVGVDSFGKRVNEPDKLKSKPTPKEG